MRRNRVVAATLSVVVLGAVACGHEESRNPPTVASVDAPDPELATAPAVATAKSSVVEISGESPNCTMGGSGFVVAPDRVMTPAQVVAGGETFTVDLDGRTFDAHVVSFDPKRDLAILDVPNLPAAPLQFATGEAAGGSDAVLLGYSDSGDFRAVPAQVREVIQLNGPDVYRTTTVSREVYTITGSAKDLHGGPLVDRDGKVLGIAFGEAVDQPDTSFALTAKEIAPQLSDLANTVPVAAGDERC